MNGSNLTCSHQIPRCMIESLRLTDRKLVTVSFHLTANYSDTHEKSYLFYNIYKA